MTLPTSTLDTRFSDPAAQQCPWPDTLVLLREAELYWFTSVRADGRPHVTPVVGAWWGDGLCVVTGETEQKARNLDHNRAVAVTTGHNRWDSGTDVVLEGRVQRLAEPGQLGAVAEAFLAKYGEAWRFEVAEDGFASPGGPARVLQVRPERVLTFAKDPHGQTTHRFPTA